MVVDISQAFESLTSNFLNQPIVGALPMHFELLDVKGDHICHGYLTNCFIGCIFERERLHVCFKFVHGKDLGGSGALWIVRDLTVYVFSEKGHLI